MAIKFQTNVPQKLRFPWGDFLPISGQYGEQFLYTVELSGQRDKLYATPSLHRQLQEVPVGPGSVLTITKVEGEGHRKEWVVAAEAGPEAGPEPEAEPELGVEDLAALIGGLQAQIKAEPKKHELKAELADALLRAGLTDEAVRLLDQLPGEVQEHEVARRARARLGFVHAVEHSPRDVDLAAAVAADPGNLLARHQLGARLLLAGQYAAGMDQFLAILKADRKFDEDLGRRALLDAFRIVPEPELVGDYRRRMSSLLF